MMRAIGDGVWVGGIDVHTIDFAAARGEIGDVGDLRRHERDPQGELCDMVLYAAIRADRP